METFEKGNFNLCHLATKCSNHIRQNFFSIKIYNGRENIFYRLENHIHCMILYHMVEGITICLILNFLTIYHNRSNGKTVIRNDGYGQALAVLHVSGTSRAHATTFASCSSNRKTIMGEGRRDGMMAAHIVKCPAILRGHLVAIHRERSDIVTLLGYDGVTLTAIAQNIGNASRCDAATLARISRNSVTVALESSR